MTFTFLKWKKACDVQGFDRNALPHTAFWQPYTAYYALVGTTIMTFVGGYTVFLPGAWDVPNFLFSYLMVAVFPILFVFWKLLVSSGNNPGSPQVLLTHLQKKTKWRKPHEVDLAPRALLDEIEAYEASYTPKIPKYIRPSKSCMKLTSWQEQIHLLV